MPQTLFTATQANGFDEGARLLNPKPPFKRGDLFEIILIQIKGGGAKRPDKNEIKRLRDLEKYYNARDVVLAEWVNRKSGLRRGQIFC